MVHRKRHAVDRRTASPLLAFAACRPHHTHGLGRAIMPMGEKVTPSVGVMLRTGRCRRITRRKRVRKAKRTRARQTSGPSRPSHSVRRRSGHRCGRPLGSHPSHGRDRNAPSQDAPSRYSPEDSTISVRKCNERLFETIINHSGALISELCPGTVPEARRFLIRNRLIAALSSTLIVAQARARSGALNTAGWANELNRRVFAVPGDVTMPHNTGCNRLIQEGQASIICSLTDIDEFCHAAHRPQSADAADNDDEPSEESTDTSLSQPTNATAAILKAIRTCSAKYGHVSTDGLLAILAESNPGEYSISRISMELGLMELNGLICTQHGNITITDASAT